MEKNTKYKFWPLILTFLIVVVDQITKALVVKYIPPYTINLTIPTACSQS